MTFDVTKFNQTCNPHKNFDKSKAEDRRYYIDFSEVRVAEIIRELKK